MSDAPERIWATPEDGYCTATDIGGDKRHALGFVEYVRADVIEALQARVAELEAASTDKADAWDSVSNARRDARAKALEEAADVADGLSVKWWEEYKDRTSVNAGSTYTEGMSEGGAYCASAIRALIATTPDACEGESKDAVRNG